MKKFSIEKMKELYYVHKGCHHQVAKEMGCTREYVRQKLTPLGLTATGKKGGHRPPSGPRKYTEAFVRDLYEKGEGRYYKMALIEGVTSSVISLAISKLGLRDELRSKSNQGRPRKKVA